MLAIERKKKRSVPSENEAGAQGGCRPRVGFEPPGLQFRWLLTSTEATASTSAVVNVERVTFALTSA